MKKRIYNPPTPYVAPLQTRLAPGKTIGIEGTVPSAARRFYINLQCGSHTTPQQSDIALQIVVHVLDGSLALNSFQSGMWGEEQRILTLPIRQAENFNISIQCKFGRYKIAINGRDYCEFPQRVYYERISQLAIDGDVSIIRISYESVSSDELQESSSAPLHLDIQPLSSLRLADPPSYEEAISGSYEKLSQHVNLALSTSSATILLHPETNVRINSTSHPHHYRSGTRLVSPRPTVPLNAHPYTNATMIPEGAGILLNAPTGSTSRPMKIFRRPKAYEIAWVISYIIIIVMVVLLVKFISF